MKKFRKTTTKKKVVKKPQKIEKIPEPEPKRRNHMEDYLVAASGGRIQSMDHLMSLSNEQLARMGL